jgi:hypothetical protein
MPFWTVFISCCLLMLNYEPRKYPNIFLLLFWNVLPRIYCNVHINMNIKTPNALRRTNPTPACSLFLDHFLISKLALSSTSDRHSAVFCNLLYYCYYDKFQGLIFIHCGTVWLSIVSVPRALSSHLTPCRPVLFEGRHWTVIHSAKLLFRDQSNNLLCPLDFCWTIKLLYCVDVQMHKPCIMFILISFLSIAIFSNQNNIFVSLHTTLWRLWSKFPSKHKWPLHLTRLRVYLGLVN